MKLYSHQKSIIEEDRKVTGIWHGTGGAKTRTTLELAKNTKTLVIMPKQQFLDKTWENNRDKFDIQIDLTTISKETFRRDWEKLPRYETVIIDESHGHFGVLPDTRQKNKVIIPKTSQLFEATLKYIQKIRPDRFYMCTATPVSKPMNVWAIAKLFGKDWDFFKFREKYYIQRKMGYHSIWLPNNSQANKDKLIELIQMFGYVGSLSSWFDVPDQIHKNIFVSLTPEQEKEIRIIKQTEADPMVKRTKLRTIENGCLYESEIETISGNRERLVKKSHVFKNEKIEHILQLALEFPKLLIFANYTAQVHDIADKLEKEGYKVFRLTGQTKDRENLIKEAENLSSCIVVSQSGISAGYELKSVRCTIFASLSNRVLDKIQAEGRTLRADNLQKNLFIHLIVKGGIDELCYNSIEKGVDFSEKIHE